MSKKPSKVAEVRWADGSRFTADPVKVHAALTKIRERDGNVTPEAVVAAARAKNSPMHSCFTWDDTVAAQKFREEQARGMIRKLVVRYPEAPHLETRVLESITQPATESEPERRVYQDTATIMRDPVTRDELLAKAVNEALAFRKRYHALSELAKVFAAFDEFLMNAGKAIGED